MKNDTLEVAAGNFLDKTYSVAVLAGLFEMSPSNIYQLQQRGLIDVACSYRKAIQSYIAYWKGRATTKQGSVEGLSVVRKAELDRARAVEAWYRIRRERGELIDVEEFVNLAQPIFTGLRTELVALERKYPDMREDIDRVLNGIAKQGVNMLSKRQKELDAYVENEIAEMEALEQEITEAAPEHPPEDF